MNKTLKQIEQQRAITDRKILDYLERADEVDNEVRKSLSYWGNGEDPATKVVDIAKMIQREEHND